MRVDLPPAYRLYQPVTPYASDWLPADHGHRVFWQQSGRPDGVPVLIVHGGPGGGSVPIQRQFFDPAFWRVVQFDQRGCGRSTPLGDIRHNTTELLIADMERLRQHLGIQRWALFGGSWGSTLALAYGVRYPQHCLGFLLRGIFLMRLSEILWFFDGMARFFPEAAERFRNRFPGRSGLDLLSAYRAVLTGPDSPSRQQAALEWVRYESACSSFQPVPAHSLPSRYAESHWAMAVIEAHYFHANRFTPDDHLLAEIHHVRHLPAVLLHGRYDVVCPPETAHALARRWPEARLRLLANAGHSSLEPEMMEALLEETEVFKRVAAPAPAALAPRLPAATGTSEPPAA